ncbi:hypothetical protein BDR26DRAFT_871965 [Obelidium mucronatum]|nr:hypothetical protein BDR26DRAFT_871965 [Obelidium mucronatum]
MSSQGIESPTANPESTGSTGSTTAAESILLQTASSATIAPSLVETSATVITPTSATVVVHSISANDSPSSNQALSTGAIIGIVFGSLFVVGVCIGLLVWVRRCNTGVKGESTSVGKLGETSLDQSNPGIATNSSTAVVDISPETPDQAIVPQIPSKQITQTNPSRTFVARQASTTSSGGDSGFLGYPVPDDEWEPPAFPTLGGAMSDGVPTKERIAKKKLRMTHLSIYSEFSTGVNTPTDDEDCDDSAVRDDESFGQ